jgi:hypothetical protein
MTMRSYRRLEQVGSVLSLGAVAGWVLYALLWSQPAQTDDAKERADKQAGAVDIPAEPDIFGLVKSVDVTQRRIALAVEKEDEQEQEESYDVAKDAPVLLDGPAALGDLAIGTRVGLILRRGSQEVVALRSELLRITAQLKRDEFEVGKPIDVLLRVTNVSPTHQSFWVMLTTWDMNWRSSDPHVSWDPIYSYLNGPTFIKLGPREDYVKVLRMKTAVAGRLSFQMGFTPLADHRTFVQDERASNEVRMKFNLGKRTYWSREVTLTVRKGG